MNPLVNITKDYHLNGFSPFPLVAESKEPRVKLKDAFGKFFGFKPDDNVGLFVGSKNLLAVIDADDVNTKGKVNSKLDEMGLLPWTTVVSTPSRDGLHFWLRIGNIPAWAKVFYRLDPRIGKGEFRLKFPAYVVAPPSSVKDGNYRFLQGSPTFFAIQPVVDFFDVVSWLVKPSALQDAGNSDTSIKTSPITSYNPRPGVMELVPYLRNARPGAYIPRIDYRTRKVRSDSFPSRSEAENALVVGLVLGGWSFDQVKKLFDDNHIGHYVDQPDPTRYLEKTYSSAVNYVKREGGVA